MDIEVTLPGPLTIEVAIAGIKTFDSLSDTPASKTGAGDKLLKVDSAGLLIEYVNTPWTDLALSDSDLTGHASKYIRVKSDESGFEFST